VSRVQGLRGALGKAPDVHLGKVVQPLMKQECLVVAASRRGRYASQ
jgi:hypothetical protein